MRRSKWIIIIIGLGVLIGSGWWLLGHATTQKAQQVKQTENEQPTFYLHGYGGSDRSTDSMTKAAREQKNATQVLTATVRKDGSVDLQGRWLAKTTRPIVQVVFEDNQSQS
ncbi:alpha/beta hydrolase [Latilactobacillus curvatus]|uniref:alpha/beta hydrolase n=1 Tax=Latilactobacillus curvatus TaxID=28038 RepID=UPI0039AEB0C6